MNQQQFQPNTAMNPGLTRYQSAPSSYFSSLLDSCGPAGGFGSDDFDNIFNAARASSPEIFSSNFSQSQIRSQNLPLNPVKSEIEQRQEERSDYSGMMFQSCNNNGGIMNSNPVKMEEAGGSGGNSTLIRHRSSPAGLFDNINFENEFGAVMRSLGSSGPGNNAKPEASFSSTSRFNKSHNMPPLIPKSRSKNIGQKRSIDAQFHEDIPGFPINSWDDSSILSDSLFDGLAENDEKTFSNANTSNDHDQNIKEGEKPSTSRLSHHLSLPTNFSELSAIENFLQDSAPCKLRAKRGFATHPRSIAERVRRTKISGKIRKLQELVPNMEKQTNTSDMLDFAVDYIKDLQSQLKMLSDKRAKCSCTARSHS